MATFSEQTKFHVDLLGSFYPAFLSKFFLHEPQVAASIVLKQLEKSCPKDRTVLYLDSGRTEEKEITIKKRVVATEKNAKKLISHLESMDKKTNEGRRVSGSEIGNAFKLARNAFRLTERMKTIFKNQAEESGWSIYVCVGEADVTIGGMTLGEEDVVISGDSDLFFYPGVSRVLQPVKRGIYNLYVKSEMLQTLKLSSLQWQCLGIVSGNDYDNNVRGMGIVTNYTILQNIQRITVKETVSNYLLNEEVKKKNKRKITFQTACKVFDTATQELMSAAGHDGNEKQLIDRQFVKDRLLKIQNLAKQARIEKRKTVTEQRQIGYEAVILCLHILSSLTIIYLSVAKSLVCGTDASGISIDSALWNKIPVQT
jgi:hypothetical protein